MVNRKDIDRIKLKSNFLPVICLVAIVFTVLYFFNYWDNTSTQPDQIQNGVLDFRGYDFNRSGTANLNGKWEFYWNRLLNEKSFSQKDLKPDIYAKVPDTWIHYQINGKSLPAYGYATYRMKIKVDDSQEKLALKVITMSTAYKLFVDDRLLASNGTVSEKASGFVPEYKPISAEFIPGSKEFDLIIQVANFSYSKGGIWYSIQLGTPEKIAASIKYRDHRDIFLLGGLFVMAVYYLNFYLMRKKEISSLCFVGLCILTMLRILIYGNFMIYQVIPGITYKTIVFLDYVSIHWEPVLFLMFVSHIYPEESFPKLVRIFTAVAAVQTIINAVLPINMYTALVGADEIIIVLNILFSVLTAAKAAFRRRENSIVMLVSCSLGIWSAIHDVLYQSNKIANSIREVSTEAFFAVIVMQSFILASKFSDSFARTEKLSDELQKELEEKKELSERLIKMDKLKDEFLANTSHELKTPLNGIVGITESLINGSNGVLTQAQRSDLSLVVSSGRRLSNLVNDILDMSKLKNKEIKLDIESISITDIINSVINMFQYINTNKNVEIVSKVPDDLPFVMADANRIQQIMYNIIGNAVKFTDTGSITTYACVIGTFVRITVSDTGEGIPENMIEKIWEPFEQADSSMTRRHGGVGLGLSITKHLVELHGGMIQIESKINTGTSISFTLPVSDNIISQNTSKRKPEFIKVIDPPAEVIGNGPEILVVDDDMVNLNSVINALKLEDYSVTPAQNGAEALEILKHNRNFCLVILDIMMPDMSGYEVCRKIREDFTIHELPVLMLTASNQPESIILSFNEGANDFLTKPFELRELQARVKNLVELKKSVNRAVDMEIAFLQAQIKPHFLFNVLNTIAALCEKNPESAGELIVELSNYLRTSINLNDLNDLVPLEKELDYVNSYIKLEKARFGDELRVEYDIQADMDILIPPFIIQPLVENSIRHGIRGKKGSGTVRITIRNENNGIIFSVWDNGTGMPPDKIEQIMNGENSKSIGLININRRLKRLFGSGIAISSMEGQQTTVSMFIPHGKEKIK